MDHILLILLFQLIPLFIVLFAINQKNNIKKTNLQMNILNLLKDFIKKSKIVLKVLRKYFFGVNKSFLAGEEVNKELGKKEIKKMIELKNSKRINEFICKRKIKQKLLKITLKIIKERKIYPLEEIREIGKT